MNGMIQNIATVHKRIKTVCANCGRDSQEVKLLLAKKWK